MENFSFYRTAFQRNNTQNSTYFHQSSWRQPELVMAPKSAIVSHMRYRVTRIRLEVLGQCTLLDVEEINEPKCLRLSNDISHFDFELY
jgi:hypothetical protein